MIHDKGVSIHAPTRGATITITKGMIEALFQSTRPRGARQQLIAAIRVGQDVSIHAPTRGATQQSDEAQDLFLFQSTRPRGARRRDDPGFGSRTGFQSTRPRGARLAYFSSPIMSMIVSIHAPTRGATVNDDGKQKLYKFQSTRPRGARPDTERAITAANLFQSTRPRGARPGD